LKGVRSYSTFFNYLIIYNICHTCLNRTKTYCKFGKVAVTLTLAENVFFVGSTAIKLFNELQHHIKPILDIPPKFWKKY
jgi:hypothetical protein